MPRNSLQFEHLAMTTRWRIVLRGKAFEDLGAVASSCAEIIDEWNRLLSRYNPTSEVSRINRAKPGIALKLHSDLLRLVQLCDEARLATRGIFEVALLTEEPASDSLQAHAPYLLDPQQGTFTWLAPHRQLDFGGVAKGYVIDQLLQFVKQHNITAALFDAGGSSLLAWDGDPEPTAWQVMISAPGEGPRELVVGVESIDADLQARPRLELRNEAFAYSATRSPGALSGQTIDPRSGDIIAAARACVVVTQNAAWAEILSTASLCMGEAEAAEYIKERGLVASRLGWLAGDDVHWYSSDG